MKGLSVLRVGISLAVLAAVTYLLCGLWDLLFPALAMHPVWHGLFPGFSWSVGGFLVGLVEIIVYSLYAAVVFVPAYNWLGRRYR